MGKSIESVLLQEEVKKNVKFAWLIHPIINKVMLMMVVVLISNTELFARDIQGYQLNQLLQQFEAMGCKRINKSTVECYFPLPVNTISKEKAMEVKQKLNKNLRDNLCTNKTAYAVFELGGTIRTRYTAKDDNNKILLNGLDLNSGNCLNDGGKRIEAMKKSKEYQCKVNLLGDQMTFLLELGQKSLMFNGETYAMTDSFSEYDLYSNKQSDKVKVYNKKGVNKRGYNAEIIGNKAICIRK